jgi:quercetin dioxygenase-like cupin family protein
MNHERPNPERSTGELRELALAHALGMLDEKEAVEFEARLREGRPGYPESWRAAQQTMAALALSAPAVAPPAEVKDQLLARIARDAARAQVWKGWQAPPGFAPMVLVRGEEGSFEPTGVRGVRVRRLFVDDREQRVTMLVRMDPGASYPRHRHASAEECYVLEGDLKVGDLEMRAGDYQRAEAESVHEVQSTDQGCLLLIHSSQSDELLS